MESLEDRRLLSIGEASVTNSLATTFTVNSFLDTVDVNPGDGYARDASGLTSLRAAVMEANALSGAQTINLPTGTYRLTLGGSAEDNSATGDLDIKGQLSIIGAGASQTIIDATGLNDRVMDIALGVSTELQGLKITGGQINGVEYDRGGGIRVDFYAPVTISDCILTNNSAPRTSGTSSYGTGGAICSSGTLTILNSKFENNQASNSGGAVYVGGTNASAYIRGCTFSGNAARDGGAIKNQSPMRIEESTFTQNTGCGSSGYGTGGAIENNAGGDLTLVNCTISGNTTGQIGGGISNLDTLKVIHSTITGNEAEYGGGIYCGSSAPTSVENTIIAGNTVSYLGPDVYRTVTSLGHNLIGNTAGSTGFGATGDLLNIAPKLGPLTDNGGPTKTHALLAGSPAIDAANTATSPATDQRGVARPQGAAADIGAVEQIVGGTIRGTAWNDFDSDGTRDAGEPRLAGVAIYLDQNQNGQLDAGERSTTTDVNGVYAFSEVLAGTYTVAEVLAQGWEQTSPAGGLHTVQLTAGQEVTGKDFGNRLAGVDTFSFKAAVDGYATDSNRDGTFESLDTTSTTFKAALYAASSGGESRGLLEFHMPGIDSNATVVAAYLQFRRSLLSYSTGTPAITVRGYTGDGVLTTGDASAAASLVGSASVADTADLSIPIDTSFVQNLLRGGWLAGLRIDAAISNMTMSGYTTEGVYPGLWEAPKLVVQVEQPEGGTIRGTSWNDLDGDGTHDTAEPGMAGVQVFLDQNGNGQLDSGEPNTWTLEDYPGTEADETGTYVFAGLSAGTYNVAQVMPEGWERTTPATGTHSVPLTLDQEITGKDFGNRLAGVDTLSLATKADGYAKDDDLNGVFEGLDTTRTDIRTTHYPAGYSEGDRRGLLEFDLSGIDPEATIVAAYLQLGLAVLAYSSPSDGVTLDVLGYTGDGVLTANDATATATLVGQAAPLHSNTGSIPIDPAFLQNLLTTGAYAGLRLQATTLYTSVDTVSIEGAIPRIMEAAKLIVQVRKPQPPENGEIHGTAWNDLDGDGIRETLEPALQNRTVFIDANNNGTLDRGETSVVTDASGAYGFTELVPGSYVIRESLPSDWLRTTPSAGFFTVALASGQTVTDRDFGSRYGRNTLTVEVGASSISEAAGPNATTGRVTRTGDLSRALTVTLASSDTTEVTVPDSVVIPAGQTSCTFPINAVNDAITDGTRKVTITASTPLGQPVELDASFGDGGVVLTALHSYPASVVVQSDGKIVAGSADVTNSWQITRVTSEGSLDQGFGTNGVVLTPMQVEANHYSRINRILVQPDGKILVAGGVPSGEGAGKALLVRYNSDGSLDATFGKGGVADVSYVSGWIEDIAIRPDGKIVLAISFSGSAGLRAVQLNSDGTLDNSFGTLGTATIATAWALAKNVVLLDDGRIILAGSLLDGMVACLRPDGVLDTTFGTNGVATVDFPSSYFSLEGAGVDSKGRIVLGGYVGGDDANSHDMAVARLTPEGRLDASFSEDGVSITDIGGFSDVVYAAVVQSDDKIVLAGYTEVSDGVEDVVLVRYDVNGNLDPTFDGDGCFLHTVLPTNNERILNAALQDDGKLVAVVGPSANYPIVRYQMVGPIENSVTVDVTDDDGELRGTIWDDRDGDGTRDGDEPGLAGATLYLDQNNNGQFDAGEISTMTVADNPDTPAVNETGTYVFTGLQAGTYRVAEVIRNGWIQTSPTPPTGTHLVTLASGETKTGLDFGNHAQTAPVAVGDTYQVAEDTLLTRSAPGVLGNDSDANSDLLSAILVTGPSHGSLTLNANGSFTYQPAANYNGPDSFTYKVNDGHADSNVATVSITVNPINDPPTLTLSNKIATLAENTSTASHVKVADIIVSDDGRGANILSLAGADAALFEIDGNVLYLKAGKSLDYETKQQLNVVVQVDDSSLGTTPDSSASLTITIADVNESPTGLLLSKVQVPENSAAGTVVGLFTTTDPDADNTFTYALVSGEGSDDNRFFAIAGNQLKTTAAFDFETQSSYSIRVRTTDQGGLPLERQFTITVTDVDDMPPIVAAVSPSIAGGTWDVDTTSVVIDFSEPVAGGGSAANYQLQSLGPDALLGTADDTIIPLSVSYTGSSTTLQFAPLPESVYRLTIRDTLVDARGNVLDGNRDGLAGGAWVADFVVKPAAAIFEETPTCGSGGTEPSSVATADFDGDGIADLAVANARTGKVGILLGMGNGTFSAAVSYGTGGSWPLAVAVGDFNADGKSDLAVVNSSSSNVAILLGTGSGTFTQATTFASGGTSPSSVAVGDFNADGKPDLAVANSGSSTVGILLGTGSGTFADATTLASGGDNPRSVAVGDFNGDGRSDLAVANWSSSNVAVLLGTGSGTFAQAKTYQPGGAFPTSVVVGDFNNDGKSDLAVANNQNGTVGILLGSDNGGFSAVKTSASGVAYPESLISGDFDADGTMDLAVVDANGTVGILSGAGNGLFTATATYSSGGASPVSAATGDFDADGDLDLALANRGSDTVGILLAQGDGTFSAVKTLDSGGFFPYAVATGDFNADGNSDLAVANAMAGNIGILLGSGSGTFAAAVAFDSGGDSPRSVAVGDFNADGNADLAVANYDSGTVGILLGSPNGRFAPATVFSSGGVNPYSVVVADFNADGMLDLAVANWESDNIGVLLGKGNGSFSPVTTYNTGGTYPKSLAVADFNADGFADLAVANMGMGDGTVGLLLGTGSGTFLDAATFSSGGPNPCCIATGDFNADGRPDLAVTNAAGSIGILFGVGDGTLVPPTTYRSGGTQPAWIVVGDFTGDGLADVAVANSSSGTVAVLPGMGKGTFGPAQSYSSGGTDPLAIAVDDFNADRKADLVAVHGDAASTCVLRNIYAPTSAALASPNGMLFDVQVGGNMAGQLLQGTNSAFDGLNRLQVDGADYAPAWESPNLQDGGRTLVTPSQTISGLTVSREITVPTTGSDDFARTVDVFTNPTARRIRARVRIVGNLGADGATTVFATSDGDTLVEPTDQWIGTDDADGTGTPAVLHYLHGPGGLQPVSVVRTGDNLEWTYELTVEPGQCVRLAHFTIVATTQAEAQASADRLVTNDGFGGEAAAFLTESERFELANFNRPPTALDLSASAVVENQPAETLVGLLATVDPDTGEPHAYSLVSGTGDTDNDAFAIAGNELRAKASFNYEAKASYSIRLRTTDELGQWCEDVFAIAITDVNEPPTDLHLSKAQVPENAAAGTLVGVFTATDPDAGDTFTYELVSGLGSTDNAAFAIVGNELRTTASLDYEAQSTYAIRVRATDADGLPFEMAITINLADIDEPPSAVDDEFQIDEDAILSVGSQHPTGSQLLVMDGSSIVRYDAATGECLGSFLSYPGYPSGLFMTYGPDENLYVGSGYTPTIRRYNGRTGELIDVFTSGVQLDGARNMTFGPDGDLYVTNTGTDQIYRFDGITGQYLGPFTSGATVRAPIGLTFCPDGNLYVASGRENEVIRFDGSTGEYMDVFVQAGSLDVPQEITFGPDGNLYVGSQGSRAVFRYSGITGKFIDKFASPIGNPQELLFDANGDLLVANYGDSGVGGVQRFDGETGAYLGQLIATHTYTGSVVFYAPSTARTGILENDTDPEGRPLSAILVDPPTHGRLVFNVNGSFRYVPDAEFSGTDQFTYRASDGQLTSELATVKIVVRPVDDPPTVTLVDTTTTLTENTKITDRRKVADILVSDDDLGTHELALAGADAGMFEIDGNTLYLKADTQLDYETNRQLDVTVAVDDPQLGSTPDSTASLSITITDVGPTAEAGGPYTVSEGGTVVLAGSGQGYAGGSEGLTYAWDFDGDGQFDDATGPTPTFPATLLDGPRMVTIALQVTEQGESSVDTATVTVKNVAPRITELTAPEMIGEGLTMTVSGRFQDGFAQDGHTALIDWGDGTSSRATVDATLGRFTASHSYDKAGQYTVTATVQDDDGGVDQKSLSIQVVPHLGTIGFRTASIADLAGRDLWYCLETTREGYLTSEGLATTGGTLELELYDDVQSETPLATSVTTNEKQRLDIETTAGKTYYLRVHGTGTGVRFCVANLVHHEGKAFDVFGAEYEDEFVFDPTSQKIAVNGLIYQIPDEVSVHFEGEAGEDGAVLLGTEGDDSAVLTATGGRLVGAGYQVTLTSIAHTAVYARGGTNSVYLNGTDGEDTFTAQRGEATLAGTGYSLKVTGFEAIHGIGAGGGDTAVLRDSAGAERLVARPEDAQLYGQGFYLQAKGFSEVTVHATPGSGDRAELYDSRGNDTLTASPSTATLAGTGFSLTAAGFDTLVANASGGHDRALLSGSAGRDEFSAYPQYSLLRGEGYSLQVNHFDEAQAEGQGGGDVARLYDSLGDDVFTAQGRESRFAGIGFATTAVGFANVLASALRGGLDTARLQGVLGESTVTVTPHAGTLAGPGYACRAEGFANLVDASPTEPQGTRTLTTTRIDTTTSVPQPGTLVLSGTKAAPSAIVLASGNSVSLLAVPHVTGSLRLADAEREAEAGLRVIDKLADAVHAADSAEPSIAAGAALLPSSETSVLVESQERSLRSLYESLACESAKPKASGRKDQEALALVVDRLFESGIWE